jgi:hypothetical protein
MEWHGADERNALPVYTKRPCWGKQRASRFDGAGSADRLGLIKAIAGHTTWQPPLPSFIMVLSPCPWKAHA